ncbi:MAG: hypothetical protein KAT68_10105 [Bacteroidales bacterium]|nr:hypothetical protein [Bacteroidales bacterium]
MKRFFLLLVYLSIHFSCFSQEIFEETITIMPFKGIIIGNDSILFENMTIEKLKEIYPMVSSNLVKYEFDNQVKDSIVDMARFYFLKNIVFTFYDNKGFTRIKILEISENTNIFIKPNIEITGEYVDFFKIFPKKNFDTYHGQGEKGYFSIISQGLIIETPNKEKIKAITIYGK